MKKLILIAGAVLALSGCAAIQKIESANAPSLRTIYELRATYDAVVLAPATNYSRLPHCASGQKSTIKSLCSDISVIKKLQMADQQVQSALDNVEAFTRAHPGDLGVNGLYSAASLAISQAEQIASAYGVK